MDEYIILVFELPCGPVFLAQLLPSGRTAQMFGERQETLEFVEQRSSLRRNSSQSRAIDEPAIFQIYALERQLSSGLSESICISV